MTRFQQREWLQSAVPGLSHSLTASWPASWPAQEPCFQMLAGDVSRRALGIFAANGGTYAPLGPNQHTTHVKQPKTTPTRTNTI